MISKCQSNYSTAQLIPFLSSVPAPVCPSVPTSSNGVITVRWSYTHTGGLELTQVIVTATKGNLATDVPNGNLTDPSQMYLNIDTFTAGFSYTFTVTAYNQLGSSTVQCNPVTHQMGKLAYFNHICRLSQSGIIIRSLRNASKNGFLKFHPRASSLVKFLLLEVLFSYITSNSTIAICNQTFSRNVMF